MVNDIIQYVRNNGLALRDLPPQQDDINKIAISNYPWGIQYIKNPSEELQLIAINKDPFVEISESDITTAAAALQEEMLLELVSKSWQLIEYCPRYSSVQLCACNQNKSAYNLIKNPVLHIKLAYG